MVRDLVTELCERLAPLSVGVFDAIGVDDDFHGSCLGRSDGQVYAEIIKRVESDPTCYEKASWIDKIHQIRETGRALRTKE